MALFDSSFDEKKRFISHFGQHVLPSFLTLFVFITHRVEFITKQHGTLLENCKKIRGY